MLIINGRMFTTQVHNSRLLFIHSQLYVIVEIIHKYRRLINTYGKTADS